MLYRQICKLILVMSFFCSTVLTAQEKLSEVSHDDYLTIVKNYADAMIKHGRDTYGKQKSPLFAAALNRKTMKLDKFPEIKGVRNHDRSLTGSNPQTDQELYLILYELSKITGDKKYAKNADAALEFFFKNAQSPKTGLMAWGEHIFWDFKKESVGGKKNYHEICGEWELWEVCYRLAPEASWAYAIGVWNHQIADQKTGDFSRHATWAKHGPGKGADFPRYAGQMILTWADAYTRQENADREDRDQLLKAIEVIITRMEKNQKIGKSGFLIAGTDKNHRRIAWPGSNLEFARCVFKSMPLLPDGQLKDHMLKIALKQDVDFLGLAHPVTAEQGFAVTVDINTGQPRTRSMNQPYTSLWSGSYGTSSHAKLANLCYARYSQLIMLRDKTGRLDRPDLVNQYRKLILKTADLYLASNPDKKQLIFPESIAAVINLLGNAYEITDQKHYLKAAEKMAALGIELFMDQHSALPKASNQHEHYETITGGPAFMNALLRMYFLNQDPF